MIHHEPGLTLKDAMVFPFMLLRCPTQRNQKKANYSQLDGQSDEIAEGEDRIGGLPNDIPNSIHAIW
jgi:hypothetical protein